MSNDTLCPWNPSSTGLGLSARAGLWGWAPGPGSTLDGTAYHCLACSSLPAELCQRTHSSCTDYAPKVDTDTSAPPGLLCSCPGLRDRAAAPGQGQRGTDTAQSCQHPLHAQGCDWGQPWLSHQSPVETSAPEEQPLGQISKEMPCSRKSTNELSNY